MRTKKYNSKLRSTVNFYLYVSPWLIVFLLFTVIPMAFSLVMSFTSAKITTLTTKPLKFIGFENYTWVFAKDTRFLRSIGNTLLYSFLRVFLGTALALLVAMLLNMQIKGRKIFRTMIYLPAIIPIVGSTLLWKLMIFQDRNIVSYLFTLVGLDKPDFLSPERALFSVVGINIWSGLGPSMLILLAGLQGVPQDLLEAARIDGANAAVRFYRITLPMISSTVFFSMITGFIGAIQVYAEVKLLTGSMSETVTMAMLVVENAFALDAYGIGYASAQGWLIFILTMLLTAVFFVASKRKVYYAGE
ncbi:MAG: sugar ABC transporter permease [Clostridia bacterium]|nr:sugar ABC transporter permease [Clostridia bacterium]